MDLASLVLACGLILGTTLLFISYNQTDEWRDTLDTIFMQPVRRFILYIITRKNGPLPKHVAFIMDGNRRWAKEKGMHVRVSDGHSKGSSVLFTTLKWCYEADIHTVTAYAFSIENFKRSQQEIDSLFDLVSIWLERIGHGETNVHKYQYRIRVVGEFDRFPPRLMKSSQDAMEATKHYLKRTINICVAYTSRREIMFAMLKAVEDKYQERLRMSPVSDGPDDYMKARGLDMTRTETNVNQEHVEWNEMIPEFGPNHALSSIHPNAASLVDETAIDKHLMTTYLDEAHGEKYKTQDPELLIRTSGETRLSDFLLWQSAFSHLVFLPILWPDLKPWHFLRALISYQKARPRIETAKLAFKRSLQQKESSFYLSETD